MSADVYTRITDQIVESLEAGVRPRVKPWDAEHAAGKITRPLRHNGIRYVGINVVMLWSSAVAQGCGSAPNYVPYSRTPTALTSRCFLKYRRGHGRRLP